MINVGNSINKIKQKLISFKMRFAVEERAKERTPCHFRDLHTLKMDSFFREFLKHGFKILNFSEMTHTLGNTSLSKMTPFIAP